MKHIQIQLLILLVILQGCTYYNDNKLKNDLKYALPSSEYILNEFKNSKILFLGENHAIINEEMFLTKNLEDFYQAGLRYIFLESRYVDSFPGEEGYFYYMFYPWVPAGWRYELLELYQSITMFNIKLPENEKIKIIVPEEGRQELSSNDPRTNKEFINYRDAYARNIIIEKLENTLITEKAIILYGANHGIKNKFKENKLTRYPLGYLLSLEYGNEIKSYKWYNNDVFFGAYFSHEFWNKNIASSIFLYSKYLGQIDNAKKFDGFILERENIYGSFYQYVPTKENILYLIQNIKDFKPTKLAEFNITNPNSQFLKSIYYLKLYYPDIFKYNFWNLNDETNSNEILLNVVELLEFEIHKEGITSDIIKYALENRGKIQKFHQYMIYSNINDFLNNYDVMGLEYYLDLAKNEFPYDIWPLYWKAFYQTEKEDYVSALKYWEELFSNPLSFCLETLPLSYKKAAKCALKLGYANKAERYIKISKSLRNEYGIDTTGYFYTGNLNY